MKTFFMEAGVMAWPILLIAITNLILAIRGIALISGGRPERRAAALHATNGILFWGALAVVFGFLGQHTGLYNALTVISGAEQISPSLVAKGLAESFTTTIFGMNVLILSAIAWFALRAWHRRRFAA